LCFFKDFCKESTAGRVGVAVGKTADLGGPSPGRATTFRYMFWIKTFTDANKAPQKKIESLSQEDVTIIIYYFG